MFKRPNRPGKPHRPEPHKPPQPKISLLIPFSTKNKKRRMLFEWLLAYWEHELPDAEIVIGKSSGKVFCKGEALNDAASRATGKVLVILDADALMEGRILDHAADRILEDLDEHLWFVPYRRLFRLTEEATERIIASDPEHPLFPTDPPPPEDIDGNSHHHRYGHRYGAMVMMFPREALDVLGCFDERFRGWGGEEYQKRQQE